MSEIIEAFPDRNSWQNFLNSHRLLLDRNYIESIATTARANGVRSAFLGDVAPDDIRIAGPNLRETLLACGLNPRQRAVLELIALEPWFPDRLGARIYAAEALTPFALALRGRFARFIGSEFVSSDEARTALYPIDFQDLTALSLKSDAFDCIITNDCLEHIPDIAASLSEMHRVLRHGGAIISTFPFSFAQTTIVKSRLRDGAIEYLTDPEYHGNPAEPNKGSLVFQIPGWDILDMCRVVGFSRAEMVFVSSIEHGITATDVAGILVLRCYK